MGSRCGFEIGLVLDFECDRRRVRKLPSNDLALIQQPFSLSPATRSALMAVRHRRRRIVQPASTASAAAVSACGTAVTGASTAPGVAASSCARAGAAATSGAAAALIAGSITLSAATAALTAAAAAGATCGT